MAVDLLRAYPIKILETGGAIFTMSGGNLYTGENCLLNEQIQTSGQATAQNGAYITDFMRCSCENGIVVVRCLNLNAKDTAYPYPERIAYYDEDKNFLGAPYCGGNTTFTEVVDNYLLIYLGSTTSSVATQSYISNIRYFRLELRLGTSQLTDDDILTPDEFCITID